MKYVVDASVAVKWYLPEIYTTEAEKLLAPQNELFAPELILPEFGNIIWKRARRGDLTEAEGKQIIKDFFKVKIFRYRHKSLLPAALHGALQTGQTVYDWSYLALAVSLDCEMVTADQKFYQALETTKLKKHLLFVGDVV